MSHLSAEACTQRLAAGRGDGYRHACSYGMAEHWTTGKPLVQLIFRVYSISTTGGQFRRAKYTDSPKKAQLQLDVALHAMYFACCVNTKPALYLFSDGVSRR